MSEPTQATTWGPLSAAERRVLGVLIEKQKTTPEYYPMTIAALVAGCNQKSNRDPVVHYEAEEVEQTLHSLRQQGVVVLVDTGGRALKWKHQAYDWFGLKGRPAEMAVLAELMLRGPQTEGELRQRASRMEEITDLPALQALLAQLHDLGLVIYLSPPGQKRGVMVTHALYPPDELARVREQTARAGTGEESASVPRSSSVPAEWHNELAALRAELERLNTAFLGLSQDVDDLKRSLGA